MPTIKRKVEMILPQLIEWVWDNNIKNERYRCSDIIPYEYVWINENYDVELDDDMRISKNDTFTVEVEEEITEDTVVPRLVVRHRDTGFTLYENDYINNEFPLDSVQAFYILNDDLTLTLIWRDGKLVE